MREARNRQARRLDHSGGGPEALVVAASTGGLEALSSMLAGLGAAIARVPVFVVLHMPRGFEGSVTSHVARMCGRETCVAGNGEAVRAGVVYFAPPERHLEIVREKGRVLLRLHDGPALHFCKPAADHLFRSAAHVYGRDLVGVVLSGMGADGCAGAADIVREGGQVLAQDEESSAVWGMPGAVIEAGHAMAPMRLEDIAGWIARALQQRSGGAVA